MSQQKTMVPIINLPDLYHNGCGLLWASNTTLTVNTGQVRDSTNTYDIAVNSSITINAAANGANGLDTGTLAATTGYYVFVISDPTNTNVPAGLISLSPTAPVMPSVNGVTYGAFRLVGFVVTDGSSHFLKFYTEKGNDNVIYQQYNNQFVVLNAGSSSAANVNLGVCVPAYGYGMINMQTSYTPHAQGESASVSPVGAAAATYTFYGQVASAPLSDAFAIMPNTFSGNPSITYALSVTTSPAALSLYVVGFHMHL